MKPTPHGTFNGYNNYCCRCEACRSAASEYRRTKFVSLCPECGAPTLNRYRPERLCWDCYVKQTRENLVHGNETGYQRGCRCEPCKEAGARARRLRRQRNPEVRLRENRKRMEKYYAKSEVA